MQLSPILFQQRASVCFGLMYFVLMFLYSLLFLHYFIKFYLVYFSSLWLFLLADSTKARERKHF